MQNKSFPQKYNSYLWAPVAIALVGVILNYVTDSTSNGVWSKLLSILGLLSLGLVIATYVAEIRFVRRYFPTKKFRFHALLLTAAVLAPVIAVFAGDTAGSANFSDESFGASVLGTGLAVGLTVGLLFLYAIAIDTLIYIRTKGLSSGHNVFSKIIYALAWLIIAGVSYIMYGIIYSLHDPSTE